MTGFYPTGSAVRRAIEVLRHQGLKSFSFKLLGEIGYRRLMLLERSLAQPVADATPGVPLHIHVLNAHAVDEYLVLRPESARAVVADRLRRGHFCFVARHEERLVGACWTATQRAWTDFLDREIELSAGEAYLYDAFTHLDYRGVGVAPALYAHQLQQLKDAGYRRAIRATLPENRPALRASYKSGFRPTRVIGRLKLGPWRRDFARPWKVDVR